MSGRAWRSQAARLASRLLTLLILKVAIFISGLQEAWIGNPAFYGIDRRFGAVALRPILPGPGPWIAQSRALHLSKNLKSPTTLPVRLFAGRVHRMYS